MAPASSVTLTQDESTERAALYADISTIVKEQTAQFISGALDIEENWDAYISALEASGMERAIEITQLRMTVTWPVSSNSSLKKPLITARGPRPWRGPFRMT